jgi:hypothetical protein
MSETGKTIAAGTNMTDTAEREYWLVRDWFGDSSDGYRVYRTRADAEKGIEEAANTIAQAFRTIRKEPSVEIDFSTSDGAGRVTCGDEYLYEWDLLRAKDCT